MSHGQLRKRGGASFSEADLVSRTLPVTDGAGEGAERSLSHRDDPGSFGTGSKIDLSAMVVRGGENVEGPSM